MSLLPSRPDVSAPDSADPRVVDVDSEDADEVLAALSSKTARELLSALYQEPAPPADLADRVDTSVQNVQYHLEKLEEAGAIEVVDTAYSEKGREMDVYAPADQPLVIFAGDEEEESTLRTALSRLLGSVGVLAAASFVVQAAFGNSLLPWDSDGTTQPSGSDGGEPAGAESTSTPAQADGTPTETSDGFEIAEVDTATPTETPTPEPTITPDATPTPDEIQTTAEAATGLPPGVLFFAGGLFVLTVVVIVTYAR